MEPFFEKILKKAEIDWKEISSFFIRKTIPSHTTLLYEGDVADRVFFITKGTLRLWHNDNGQDITMQFFFENQIVSSFESFYSGEESVFSIESIAETELYSLTKKIYQNL